MEDEKFSAIPEFFKSDKKTVSHISVSSPCLNSQFYLKYCTCVACMCILYMILYNIAWEEGPH